MQYKTIIMELLNQLPRDPSDNRTLHSKMESLAIRFRQRHLEIKEDLQTSSPSLDPQSLSSQALELALDEIKEELNL